MNLDITDIANYRSSSTTRKMKYQLLVQGFLAVIGILFAVTLYDTCMQQPLFPFQPNSNEWTKIWLFTTVGDFYVLSACLSTIILCSEPLLKGVLWVILINCLGSPFACLYLILKLNQTNRAPGSASKRNSYRIGAAGGARCLSSFCTYRGSMSVSMLKKHVEQLAKCTFAKT